MPKNDIALFCRNVRTLRIQHGLTPAEMALMLELSEELLNLLESGILTDEMDVRILEHIHDEFGIMPGTLFTEEL